MIQALMNGNARLTNVFFLVTNYFFLIVCIKFFLIKYYALRLNVYDVMM